jgi:uncharacterized protein YfaS (alpha-2-macroglobulin family)
MTFELKFDVPMATAGMIGIPVTNSPLVIGPPLAGAFTWLSPHSGVFTPSEPLALDTRYELTLRPGLLRADSQHARAYLRRFVTTPCFSLVASSPHQPETNATSEPEVKLLFNAEIRAADAQDAMSFHDAAGRRVAADVRQGTVEETDYELNSCRTWLDEFHAAKRISSPERQGTNELPNFLVVTPRQNLPIGQGWKLFIPAGIPAHDRPLRLRQAEEVPIGDVTPFQVENVTARNFINAGPSIRLSFSKALAESLTNGPAGWLKLDPCPTNLTVQVGWREVTLRGAFNSGSDYKLKLLPGFEAAEPFHLSGSNTFSLRIPHVAPRLYFPAFSRDQLAGGNRSFPLLTINVPKVRVRTKLLDPQTAIHALRGYRSYFVNWNERRESDKPDEYFRPVSYNLIPGRTVFNEQLDTAADPDTSKALDLHWDQLLHGRKTGIVFLDAERAAGESDRTPDLGTQALIQLTDLGLVWKNAAAGVDVFVFSHSTGRAVPGATARLFSDENEILGEALTDARGLTHLAANTNADWVGVQLGEDFHAVVLKENRVWLNHYDLDFTGSDEQEDTRRVLLISDRRFYRPGEPMHLFALVRNWADEGLTIPASLTGTLDCLDSRGRRFFQTNAAFSTYGSWSITVPLPAASHGGYLAKLHLGTNEYDYSFSVQDFQASAFEVSVQAPQSFAASEKVLVPVSARYYFGKPLSRAQVKWSLEASDMAFKPERFTSFQFHRLGLETQFRRSGSSVSLNGEGYLCSSSNFVVAPDVPFNRATPQPRLASLLVEVTDLNQQTVSHRVEFVRHSSEFYLGLRQAADVLTAGKSVPIEILALAADGHPWSKTVKARLTLQRVDWQTVRIQGAGKSVRYHNEAAFTNILEREIEVSPIELPPKTDDEVPGNRLTDLPTLPAGEYHLEATASDATDHAVISSLSFQVSAPARLSRNYRNDVQLALKPDRKQYQAGQTAEILVEAPFSGTALVTVEREKVLRSFTARLEGNAPSIRVPMQPGNVPNVFVSVTLVRGSDECPHKVKEPEYRLGFCELPVADPQSKLAVAVQPATTNCRPAEMLEVSVQVGDASGSPVPGAGVLLYAVDEGILSLSDHSLPDPHGFFYASRPLGVKSSVSLPNLLSEDPEDLSFQNKGYLVGGGGNEHLRKKFLACAFWSANLTTDAQGSTTARFAAPDSLTRYRLCAVAHAGNNRFGSGQAAFQVSKPLVIEPALPAFANLTDRLVARGLIQNQTTNAADVLISLQLDEKAKAASSARLLTRKLAIPANGSAVAEFPVELTDLGPATWVWKARFADPSLGDFTDAVQSVLEVGHVVPMLREILLSHTTGSQTNLLTLADPQLLAGRGTVTVTVANTRLNDLGEAASQLLHYPYGCAEQTGSSLLPWIVLRDATSLLPILRRGTNDMNAAIRAGIDRLFSMQTRSGGLGYWPHASEPMLWASAYGGMVLALARRHGAEVPEDDFASLLKFLSQQLRSTTEDPSDLSDRCLALYALGLAGQAEPAYHEKFYSLREKLCAEDRALLALAIAESHGPAEMIEQLLKPAVSTSRNNTSRFGCPAREQAVRLLAWTKSRPNHLILDRLVDDLMREQRQAHWSTTQGDAWSLLALTEYGRLVEGKLQPVEGRLEWGGQSIPFRVDAETNLISHTFQLTNTLGKGLILSNASTNRLYTSVLIEAHPPEPQLPRQDRGFGLQRRYERLDDENRPEDAKNLRVGDRVLVTLDLSVREPARYVAVDDALPSILEAVNPEFTTRSAGAATDNGDRWLSDFREIRKDRCLYFVDWLAPGNYTLRYVARVRAAGSVTAPAAKVEEMYHPERYGLSGTQRISSQAFE